jgi:hypothetical protein
MIEAERAFNQAVADGSANLADKEQWLDRYRRSIDGTDDRLQALQETISDTFMDGFEAAMESGEEFKDWFDDLLKQLALQAIHNQIVIPIVGQFLGVNGGTAGMVQQGMSVLGGGGNNTQGTSGGISGVVSNVGSLFGGNSMGIMISDVGGWIGGSSPLAGTGAGNYISGASANAANLANWQVAGGGMLGGVLSGALGLSGKYSAITGATGTALGSALLTPVLGPFAPLTGSFLGSALGGLIGNRKPSNKQGRATYDLLTNEVMIGGQTGKKFSQENRDAAELLSGVIARDVVGTISSLSGEELSGQLMVGVGNRDPLAFWYGTAGERDTEPQNVVIGSAYYANQGSIGVANTRDPEEFINSITEAFAELTDLDLTVYKDLADENELLIDSIKRVELQFSFVRGFFEDVGDSTEVTKEFADTWTDEFIKPILDSGESLSEGLTRLVQQYSVVKSYTDLFGQSLGNTAQGILVATDNIVKAAGGLGQFNVAASSYYQNFYSEGERFWHFSENLTNVFKDLGLELPTTTEGFRELVEGLDLTKESDQKLYATLLKLNPQVKQYIDGLKAQRDELGIIIEQIDKFNIAADATTAELVVISDHFTALAGSSQEFSSTFSSYQKLFSDILNGATELEEVDIAAVFDELGLAVPNTRKEFVDLVEGLDLSSESARDTYWQLISLAPAMDKFLRQLSDVEEAINLDPYLSAVEDAVERTKSLVTDQYEKERKAIEANISAIKTVMSLADDQYEKEREAIKANISAIKTVMSLADDQYEKEREAIEANISAIEIAMSLASDRYEKEREAIEANISAVEEQVALIDEQDAALDGLRTTVSLLKDTFDSLRLDSFENDQIRRSASQEYLRNAITTVRAGGELDNDELERHLQNISEPSEHLFGSFEDYARDFYVTKNTIGDLLEETGTQLSTEEKTLKQLRDSYWADIDYYNDELAKLDAQYEQLHDSYLADIDYYNDELAKLDAQYDQLHDSYLADIAYYNEELAKLDAQYDQLHDSYLADIAYYNEELAKLDSWYTEQIELLDSSYQQALEMYNAVLGIDNTIEGGFNSVRNAIGALSGAINSMGSSGGAGGSSGIAAGIPGFANGGFHTGGWRIVGEEGPELEYTPPSRIYSNSDSSDMFDMSELMAEVKQLREDMRSANYAIAKNTQKTAKTLEKFDYDGLPEQRTV